MENNPQEVQESVSEVAQATVETALPEGGQQQAAAQKPFKTTGQKVHKWATYLGVDWFFNTAVGVGFAYWAKYSKLGQKVWSGPITKAFDKALKPVIKDAAQRQKSAGYGNIFMSIIAGGMFTLPPLMALEKPSVIKSFSKYYDRIIHGKEKVESDPQFQAAYDNIGNEPKKDFNTGMIARFAALAPLLAIVLYPRTKKIGNKVLFDHVEHGSEFVANKLGFTAEKAFKSLPRSEAAERLKFINESVAMDFGLCLPYALMHKFWYDSFAAKKAAPKEKETAIADNKRIPAKTESYAAQEATRKVEAETVTPTLGA